MIFRHIEFSYQNGRLCFNPPNAIVFPEGVSDVRETFQTTIPIPETEIFREKGYIF